MPGILEEREMGFKSKWAHDEEVHFRMLARRTSFWVAGPLSSSVSRNLLSTNTRKLWFRPA